MITTIDNNQSVFIVECECISKKSVFCNLHDIPKVLKELEKNDNFVVYRYWNYKPKKLTKKGLNDLFTSNQINFKIQ